MVSHDEHLYPSISTNRTLDSTRRTYLVPVDEAAAPHCGSSAVAGCLYGYEGLGMEVEGSQWDDCAA